jgi:hypothetical protein
MVWDSSWRKMDVGGLAMDVGEPHDGGFFANFGHFKMRR